MKTALQCQDVIALLGSVLVALLDRVLEEPPSLTLVYGNLLTPKKLSRPVASKPTTDPTMTHTEAGVTIELVQGNIVEQDDLDAVVNAANAQLQMGGGVAGAIHGAAGTALAEETRPLAPIQPGEAVTTGGHDLPNEHIIHVLGPVYGRDEPSDELLRAGYENALEQTQEHGIASIGFPAISTGAFGFPAEAAARIALTVMLEQAPHLQSVTRIRFVLFDNDDLEVHKTALTDLLQEQSSEST